MKIPAVIPIILVLIHQTGTIAQFHDYKDNYADSLEVKLILEDEVKRIPILNSLAVHYLKNEPNKAMAKAREAFVLSQKLNNRMEAARALRNIGRSFQNLIANYDSALYYCFESIKISEAEDYKEETIETNIAIANIYSEVGNYSKSTDFLTQGEVLATELQLHEKIVEIKILRAKNLINLELTREALEELKAALKISKLHGLFEEEGKVRMALGEYYLAYSSPELSMENIKLASDLFHEYGHRSEQAWALFLTAQWHLTFGEAEDAINYFRQSLEIRVELGDLQGIAECFLNIGMSQNKISDYDAAIKTLEQCKMMAEKLNAKRILRHCYNQLFLSHSSRGDLKKAIEYRNLYVAIIELIFAEENERLIAEQQAKFDIEKKDQELSLQSKQLEYEFSRAEREKKFNLLLTLMVVILMGSGLFIFFLFKRIQHSSDKIKEINRQVIEQNQQLKRLNDTKNKFFSIIGHDLKAPLDTLTSFLGLLKNHLHKMSREEIVAVATDLEKSTKNLKSLLENLLTWAISQTNKLELIPEIIDLQELVKENFALLGKQATKKNIELALVSPGPVFCKADKNTINTTIRNLISNAIKFTYEHGKIEVQLSENKESVEVSVKDNGIGISPELLGKIFNIGTKHSTPGTNKEKGTGLGLILCKEFIQKNNGTLHVKSQVGVGSVFLFRLPKNLPATD